MPARRIRRQHLEHRPPHRLCLPVDPGRKNEPARRLRLFLHADSGKLVREYPDSRYASDALAKIDVCRGRLAQKELWVAAYYLENENNPVAARQRLEGVLKNYPRSLVIPEAMYRLADINAREGRTDEAQQMFKKLSDEYPYTEWGRRAGLRLQAAATR